jgi:hypothetical protein
MPLPFPRNNQDRNAIRNLVEITFLFLALSGVAAAQSKPNFTGDWKLNSAASDYPGNPSIADRLTRTIKQDADALWYKIVREKDGKTGEFEVDLKIGGAAYESDAAGVVTAEWQGETLVIKTLFNPGSDQASSQVERWRLSNAGKTLVDQFVYFRTDGKETHIRRVFDKQ